MKKKAALILVVIFMLFFVSCNNEPSVEIISNGADSKFSFLENSGGNEESENVDDKMSAETSESVAETKKASGTGNMANCVYITDSGTKYHTSSCRYLEKSKIEISKEDAVEQGYTACSVCKP